MPLLLNMSMLSSFANSSTIRIVLWLLVWGLALGACLSIANLPGNWGHWICGPWGCGPPLQALLACHLTWLTLLLPPAVVVRRSDTIATRWLRLGGLLLIVAATVAVASVIARERLDWWETASETHRDYLWQRCAFVVATTIDLPIVQGTLTGSYLLLASRRGS